MSIDIWNTWNENATTNYPAEKVIQFCFRKYPVSQRQGVRALDLGCGSGVHTAFLASEGFQTTGVDISPVGISNTRRRLEARGLVAVLREESVDVLALPSASIDLVICVGVYEGTGPQVAGKSVQRLTEVLSPGARGLFMFSSDRDYSVNDEGNPFTRHGYLRSEVEEMFSRGFSQVWIDRYITTYQSGRREQNEWLITVEK